MLIKQDSITGLWCREDGMVLMPPCPRGRANRHTYEWVSGSAHRGGYRQVRYQRKSYQVHRIIARAFLPNSDNLPEVDHIDRNPKNNSVDNLRWADRKMQNNNRQICEDSKTRYGARYCEDKKAYYKAYNAAYNVARKAEINVHDAAYRARQKAKGLALRKCPDGKKHWVPIAAPKRAFKAKKSFSHIVHTPDQKIAL